jgi:NADPH2:quinone reductase
MTDTMRAMQLSALGGPDDLQLVELPIPPADGRVLIEVHAGGVCFADLLMTRGRYQFRPEPPFVPGVELAGIVRRTPPDSPLREGQRVAASAPLGAWAEYAAAAPLVTFPIPDDMSFSEGTALINYQTALFGLADRGQARSGETVLIHGATGGVGSAAIDVSRALGLRTIAVARGEEKLSVARALGADDVLEAKGDWLSGVKRLTGERGVDIVFDTVGGERFLDSVRALASGGRLLVVGFAGGSIPEIKVNRLLLKNASVVGVAWAEYIRSDPQMPQRIAKNLSDFRSQGKLRPLMGASFPLERAADALRELEDRRAIGKVTLRIRN